MARKGRPSKGRKKIEIKKIETEEARHVCFSKRRIGVFTKACELSTLCGAQVAIVVDSPSGTPYSFGSPSVDSVVNSFLSQSEVAPVNPAKAYIISKLNNDFMEVSDRLTAENQKKAMLDERAKESSKYKEFEWLRYTDKASLDELNQLYALAFRARNLLREKANIHPSQAYPMTANMGFVPGMSGNFRGVFGPMAQLPPPPLQASSSGAVIGPMNYMRDQFMPGSL